MSDCVEKKQWNLACDFVFIFVIKDFETVCYFLLPCTRL